METLISILSDTYQSIWGALTASAPQLAATMLVLLGGWLVARAAKAMVFGVLEHLQFDDLSTRMGARDALKRGDVDEPTSKIAATLVYWMFLAASALLALSVWGVADMSTFGALGAMVPGVIVAATILVLGLNLSAFISKLIQIVAVNAEVTQARLVRNVAHYSMSALVVVAALRQLGVSEELLENGVLILFASGCAGMALAMGLGCRDLVGNIAALAFEREREHASQLSKASQQLGTNVFPQPVKIRRKPANRQRATA